MSAYTVPTDEPESDGTAQWDSTTIVVVQAHGGDRPGSDTPTATCQRHRGPLRARGRRREPRRDVGELDLGGDGPRLPQPRPPRRGLDGDRAVDTALWDLKARLLGLPLATLLDAARAEVPIYGSGGFTSYSDERLAAQLGGWAEQGIPRVKMKVGREPERDLERVGAARAGDRTRPELFVDANGASRASRRSGLAERSPSADVSWFEEPVSSDDLEGLRLLRDRAPAGMEIAAGEYGYMLPYFERMLAAGAVDCLQADVTRCEGITGFLRVAALCQARSLELSAHCGPSIHAHPCCAVGPLRHLEYFHDHARIERCSSTGARADRRSASARPLPAGERPRAQARRRRALRRLGGTR